MLFSFAIVILKWAESEFVKIEILPETTRGSKVFIAIEWLLSHIHWQYDQKTASISKSNLL
jgi:hypothetical protein